MVKRKKEESLVKTINRGTEISTKYGKNLLEVLEESRQKYGVGLEFLIPNKLSDIQHFVDRLTFIVDYYRCHLIIPPEIRFKGTTEKQGTEYVKINVNLRNNPPSQIKRRQLEKFVDMLSKNPDYITTSNTNVEYQVYLDKLKKEEKEV